MGKQSLAKCALFAIGPTWDDRLDAKTTQQATKRIAVKSFVADEFSDSRNQADACRRDRAVVNVACGYDEDPRTALLIDNRVDLRVLPAFGGADRLLLSPPFRRGAHRWTLTWLLSIAACCGGVSDSAAASKIRCQIPLPLRLPATCRKSGRESPGHLRTMKKAVLMRPGTVVEVLGEGGRTDNGPKTASLSA
jgi:hypothetical protein